MLLLLETLTHITGFWIRLVGAPIPVPDLLCELTASNAVFRNLEPFSEAYYGSPAQQNEAIRGVAWLRG